MMDYCGLDLLGATDVAPSLDAVRAGMAVIKKGMRGASVEYVQAMAGAKVDGDFGSDTKTAVEKFQRSNGLSVDGAVGKNTIAAMDKLAGGASSGIRRIDVSDTPTILPRIEDDAPSSGPSSSAPGSSSGPSSGSAPGQKPVAGKAAAAKQEKSSWPTYVGLGAVGLALVGLGVAATRKG